MIAQPIAHSSLNNFGPSLPTVLEKHRPKTPPWELRAADVTHAEKVLARFKEALNPARVFLLPRLSAADKKLLDSPAFSDGVPPRVREVLARELNRLIEGAEGDFDSADFSSVELRDSTADLHGKSLDDDQRKRRARLLVEDCFPEGLGRLPPDWEPPDQWLAEQGGVLSVAKVVEKAPHVAVWLLIEALYGASENGGNTLDGVLPIIGNLDQEVGGGLTRRQWFRELASRLQAGGSPKVKFLTCLEKHWGQIVLQTQSGNATRRTVNPLTYSAYCAAKLGLWYDPREQAFYWYQSKKGTWAFLTGVEIQRMLLEWMLQGDVQEAKASLQLAGQITNHLKVIALHGKTDLPELPVHLADEMLYLKEKRQPAPFSPAYFSKNQIPIRTPPPQTKPSDSFVRFLERSLPDHDDIDLFQKWCGYVLLGRNPHHTILLIRGVGGSGKSTLMDILERTIGAENVASLNVDRLDDRFELAAFRGKTLLIGKDVASNVFRSKAAHTLKALSGDQGIEAELKFENRRFKLAGPFNIAITSNADLEIGLRGDSAAWRRRLLVIDFNKPVGPKEKRLNYAQTIFKDDPEGILHWMLLGAEQVLRMERADTPLALSIRQKERLDRLLNQSSSSDFFIRECIEASPGKEVTTDRLYKQYVEFCHQQVFNPIPEEVFQKRIRTPLFQLYGAEGSDNVKEGDNPKVRGYLQVDVKPQAKWPPRHRIGSSGNSDPRIAKGDILKVDNLVGKLNDVKNPAAQWVLGTFILEQRQKLSAHFFGGAASATAVLEWLPAALNRFVGGPLDLKEARLATKGVVLRPDTAKLLDLEPDYPGDVARLKRMLLEDVFGDELAKMKEASGSGGTAPSPAPRRSPKPPPEASGSSGAAPSPGNTDNTDDVPF
jgi:P4 family phage/plasmid primase-like protien